MFLDTIRFYKGTSADPNNEIVLSDSGIAWPEDRKYKFKNLPGSKKGQLQWIDVEKERFMVWMRAAATPNFRKLYGKIPEASLPLTKGEYFFSIDNSKK